MIRVIIVGAAGRMGRRLVALADADEELSIVGAVDSPNHPHVGEDAGVLAGSSQLGIAITTNIDALVHQADVVIDFSTRDLAISNTQTAMAAGCAVVLGTTGLGEDEKKQIHDLAADGGKLVFAPNFSVGMNLMFSLCSQVPQILGDDYDIEVIEMHHNQKVDAPSGTAERLGQLLAEARDMNYAQDTVHGRQGQVGKRKQKEIGMHTVRGGDVDEDHTIIFATGGERVELTHKATSRDTFVKGALRAARFLATAEHGDYDMRQVLGL